MIALGLVVAALTSADGAVTLDDALKLLREQSPQTAADRAQLEVTAAEQITASTLPNPSFAYTGQELLAGKNTGSIGAHQLTVEQPLWIFGQRGVRQELAAVHLSADRAQFAASLADRSRAVREAFIGLLARQEQARILEESVADLSKIEAVVKGRAAAGDRSKYDVARIEAETRGLTVEAANARADVEDASGKLAISVGLPQWHPSAAGELAAGPVPTELEALWEKARASRPSIVAAQRRQLAAQAGNAVAHREALPIPALSAGTVLTHEEGGVSLVFGLSLPLPLFDRNQGAIAKSSAEAQAAELALAAEVAAVRAELVRATRVLQGRRAALEGMDKEVGDRVPAMRKMAEDSYRDGKTGILDLLDAYRSLKEIRLAYLRQLEAAKLAEVAVIPAAGLDAVSE